MLQARDQRLPSDHLFDLSALWSGITSLPSVVFIFPQYCLIDGFMWEGLLGLVNT